jgi:hypothetical protein
MNGASNTHKRDEKCIQDFCRKTKAKMRPTWGNWVRMCGWIHLAQDKDQ